MTINLERDMKWYHFILDIFSDRTPVPTEGTSVLTSVLVAFLIVFFSP